MLTRSVCDRQAPHVILSFVRIGVTGWFITALELGFLEKWFFGTFYFVKIVGTKFLDPFLAIELHELVVVERTSNYVMPLSSLLDEFKRNGVDKEYCPDLMCPAKVVFKNKNKKLSPQECVFCRNNGEVKDFYKKHILKDRDGKIVCPVLRAYTCPICGASGDVAHTIKYCPQSNSNNDLPSTVMALRTPRTAAGKRKNSIRD